jgi:hypothetical protein
MKPINIFSRQVVIIPLFAIVAIFGCKEPIPVSDTVELTRQPYLQNSFKDSISILWNTNSAKVAYVKYGFSENLDHEAQGTAFADGKIVRNTVTVKGRKRGKKYTYAIYTDSIQLASGPEYHFVTEPENHTDPFSFYAMGDIGEPVETGGFPEITSHQINRLVQRPHFGIGLGDIIYPDGESSVADPYLFKPMEVILKNIPFYPALGNHDWHVDPDQNFEKEWKLQNNEHYYSFDYANAHFIALDTRSGSMFEKDKQLAWFENDLKQAQGKYDWIFVYFHHNGITCTYKPVYKDVVEMYPLFARYNVDIVFNGHAHTYERLLPLDKAGKVIEKWQVPQYSYPEIKDGFIQITTGAGGKLRSGWQPYKLGDCPDDIVAAVGHTGHFSLIDIDGKNLKLKAISSMGGAVLDSLIIRK